jgi:hypothetical protein
MAAWRGRGLRFGAAEARWESRSAWAVTRRAIERHVRVVPGLGRASWPDDEKARPARPRPTAGVAAPGRRGATDKSVHTKPAGGEVQRRAWGVSRGTGS